MGLRFEIRCPVHGFITHDELERELIEHRVFQRLRRIRQLAWTDMVYPGAMHTRFEHSLGVMHTASLMFNDIWERCRPLLESRGLEAGAKARHLAIVRLAALLHDVGHSPFSHAGEALMPKTAHGKRYKHEDYSAAAIRYLLADVIGNSSHNPMGITAEEIADFIEGIPRKGGQSQIFWRQLMTSQLDADRADYLLRDAHHTGVQNGRYDLQRLLVSLVVAVDPETDALVLAVSEGGLHTAEALIIARYMMFTQVYFHKTRVAFDHHIGEALKALLVEAGSGDGTFPPPTSQTNVEQYLGWTDWRVLGLLDAGHGGVHGAMLRERRHYRVVYETDEVATEAQLDRAAELATKLKSLDVYVAPSKKGWYTISDEEIRVWREAQAGRARLVPLSSMSAVVKGLITFNKIRLYVPSERRADARRIVNAT